MQETHQAAAGGMAIMKALSAPGVIGVLAGAVGFLFAWPETKREGFARLVASGLSSHFFGNAVLRTIVHFAEWIPPDEIRAGAYLLAGLPGWFLLAALFKWLNKGKDIKELIQDARDII